MKDVIPQWQTRAVNFIINGFLAGKANWWCININCYSSKIEMYKNTNSNDSINNNSMGCNYITLFNGKFPSLLWNPRFLNHFHETWNFLKCYLSIIQQNMRLYIFSYYFKLNIKSPSIFSFFSAFGNAPMIWKELKLNFKNTLFLVWLLVLSPNNIPNKMTQICFFFYILPLEKYEE